jgi:flagellar FliJ protein
MKPFRLLTVERLRGRELDAKSTELHTAASTLEQAVAERDRMAQLLSGGAAHSPTVGVRTGADLDLANNFRQVLRQQIQDQEQQIDTLDAVLGEARTAWLDARGRLRAVQGLHDRHREAVRSEQARHDQRELDELAGTRRRTVRELSAETEAGIR